MSFVTTMGVTFCLTNGARYCDARYREKGKCHAFEEVLHVGLCSWWHHAFRLSLARHWRVNRTWYRHRISTSRLSFANACDPIDARNGPRVYLVCAFIADDAGENLIMHLALISRHAMLKGLKRALGIYSTLKMMLKCPRLDYKANGRSIG